LTSTISPLSLVHILLGLVAVIVGLVIFGLRKGDPRHRTLGWVYVACLLTSLVGILVRGRLHPTPFYAYAGVMAGCLVTAVLASRLRARVADWRSWHAGLMSFSMIGCAVAIGGVTGGVLIGAGSGPEYYRMFNVVIVCVTAIGLAIIATRPVIWRPMAANRRRHVRLWFGGLVASVSLALVVAQYALP
jgi:uncharacterized membrane protein